MTDKIKAQYITDKDIIYLVLPKGDYVVDGCEFSVDSYSGKECTFSYKPSESTSPTILKVIKTYDLVHFFSDNGDIMTPDDYTKKKSELLINASKDIDGDIYFSSIDDEYNYKKLSRDWKPKYKEVLTYKSIELEVNHMMLDTGSKYLEALFCFNTTQPNLVKFNRLEYQRDLLRSLCLKYNCELDIPSHSGLKFAKINSKYCFTNDALYSDLNSVETLMYDAATKRMKYIENELTRAILAIVTPLSELNKLKVHDVINKINSLSKYITDKRYQKSISKEAVITGVLKELNDTKTLLLNSIESIDK
jgi:hypothetical protein